MTKTFNEIREDLVKKINDIKDPKTGYNFSVDPNDLTDVLGVIVNDISLQVLEKTELLIRLRNSLNPFKAAGRELRDVISYRGLEAKDGTRTKTKVAFSGTAGLRIPADTELSDDSGEKIFKTAKDAAINESEHADVVAYCSNVGNVIIEENSITKFVNPIYGIAVTGNSEVEIGLNDESDNEIHLRLRDATGSSGLGFLDTLDSALMNIRGVKSAVTYVGADTEKELAAGEICCVVHGGDDKIIAQTIFEKNIFLYKYKGTLESPIIIKSKYLGRDYPIQFRRPDEYKLKCDIQIVPLSFGLPNNLDNILYENAKKFIESYSANSTIYVSDLVTFLNSLNMCKVVSGIFDHDKEDGKNGEITIEIDWNNAPVLDKYDFNVEVVS